MTARVRPCKLTLPAAFVTPSHSEKESHAFSEAAVAAGRANAAEEQQRRRKEAGFVGALAVRRMPSRPRGTAVQGRTAFGRLARLLL
jgi:hypothetical protein